MARILIIGIGNPLRGDDGLAWHATRLLEQELKGQDVEILTCHQLTPDLAEAASRSELLVLIDACAEGAPGSLAIRPVAPTGSFPGFTHDYNLETLLKTSQSLYGCYPRAVLFTITAESFPYSSELSSCVAAAIPPLVARVRALVSGFHKDSAGRHESAEEGPLSRPGRADLTTVN